MNYRLIRDFALVMGLARAWVTGTVSDWGLGLVLGLVWVLVKRMERVIQVLWLETGYFGDLSSLMLQQLK